jgi:hypothetical protein
MARKHGVRNNPYYGMALLKISHEMKSKEEPEFERLFDDTLTELQFDRKEFERFVEETREALVEIVKEIGI